MSDAKHRPKPFPVGTPCQMIGLSAIETAEDKDVIGGVVTIRYSLPLEHARAWGACFGLVGVVEPHPDTARLARAADIAEMAKQKAAAGDLELAQALLGDLTNILKEGK